MKPKLAKLSCHTGELAGTEIKITGDISIGRQPGCDLVLFPHSVSGQHARLFFNTDDGNYYIEDLGSSNGTWVDRIKVERPVKLDKLNVISFAEDIDFIFHYAEKTSAAQAKSSIKPTNFGASQNKSASQETKTVHTPRQPKQGSGKQATEFMPSFSAPPEFESSGQSKPPAVDNQNTVYQQSFTPPPDLAPDNKAGQDKTMFSKSFEPPPSFSGSPQAAQQKYTLVVNTKGSKEQFVINPGKNSVGRSSAADITISDPFISSSHATIEVKGDGSIIIEDLGSSNKTYVNGEAISTPVKVKVGTEIKFGPNSEASIVAS